MKTTSLLHHLGITGILCAGTLLFMAARTSAQVLYESEQYTGAINTFDSFGNATTFVPSSEPLAGYLAFNNSGDLFVGNNSGPAITEIAPNGTANNFGSGFSSPRGIAINAAGDVFVADFGSGQIVDLSPNGASQSVFASGLDEPLYLAFNSQGDLFESDWGSGNIYEFINGTKTLFASGISKPGTMAFNAAGDLFVADSAGVLDITPTGTSRIISMSDPQQMAFNSAGDLFIANPTVGNILEITPAGTSVFSTQVNSPIGLAFKGVTLPVPEPSVWALLSLGASAIALRLRRKK